MRSQRLLGKKFYVAIEKKSVQYVNQYRLYTNIKESGHIKVL